jgi:hypothetical protein
VAPVQVETCRLPLPAPALGAIPPTVSDAAAPGASAARADAAGPTVIAPSVDLVFAPNPPLTDAPAMGSGAGAGRAPSGPDSSRLPGMPVVPMDEPNEPDGVLRVPAPFAPAPAPESLAATLMAPTTDLTAPVQAAAVPPDGKSLSDTAPDGKVKVTSPRAGGPGVESASGGSAVGLGPPLSTDTAGMRAQKQPIIADAPLVPLVTVPPTDAAVPPAGKEDAKPAMPGTRVGDDAVVVDGPEISFNSADMSSTIWRHPGRLRHDVYVTFIHCYAVQVFSRSTCTRRVSGPAIATARRMRTRR